MSEITNSQTRLSNNNKWMGSNVSLNCNTIITKVSPHFANVPITVKCGPQGCEHFFKKCLEGIRCSHVDERRSC